MLDQRGYFSRSSYACKHTLESYYQKKLRIKEYTYKIEENLELIDSIPKGSSAEQTIKKNLFESFINYCECIYSCMEYIGYMLHIYQRRTDMLVGNLKELSPLFMIC